MGIVAKYKTVNEFLSDIVDAVKDTPWPQAIAQALPWTAPLGEAIADTVAPVKFVVNLYKNLTEIRDAHELGI